MLNEERQPYSAHVPNYGTALLVVEKQQQGGFWVGF